MGRCGAVLLYYTIINMMVDLDITSVQYPKYFTYDDGTYDDNCYMLGDYYNQTIPITQYWANNLMDEYVID